MLTGFATMQIGAGSRKGIRRCIPESKHNIIIHDLDEVAHSTLKHARIVYKRAYQEVLGLPGCKKQRTAYAMDLAWAGAEIIFCYRTYGSVPKVISRMRPGQIPDVPTLEALLVTFLGGAREGGSGPILSGDLQQLVVRGPKRLAESLGR